MPERTSFGAVGRESCRGPSLFSLCACVRNSYNFDLGSPISATEGFKTASARVLAASAAAPRRLACPPLVPFDV